MQAVFLVLAAAQTEDWMDRLVKLQAARRHGARTAEQK